MKASKHSILLYVITLVIVVTVCIQVFWNYKNYHIHKQQLINEIQTSFDKAVDDYYTLLAKKNTLSFSFGKDSVNNMMVYSSMNRSLNINSSFTSIDSIPPEDIKEVHVLRNDNKNSTFAKRFPELNKGKDTLTIENLTHKILVSLRQDSLSLVKLDTLIYDELQRKQLDVPYNIVVDKANDKYENYSRFSENDFENSELKTTSKSSLLPKNNQVTLYFGNINSDVLKRMSTGIIISLVLVLGIIACLFYLLNIIKHQKQLAEVKNDLISNMTHEFKTPIATIGVALESLKDFNALSDHKRTESYLNISNQQLTKLHMMVEKLLETATLDSHDLELKLESTNINDLLLQLKQKHQLQTDKTIHFSHPQEPIFALLDAFHFENAINNILDNAIKYGGDIIKMTLSKENKRVLISISDNGKGISKLHKEHLFDKFYRVPQGNTHDVKGFGIGLFYTKTIIEKHLGSISLDSNAKQTTFTISIPHG